MTKRLIETAFPLAEASAASLHEKNMRHGHISTLHLWPARRPLAASRAAIAAALLPDPGDDDQRKELVRRLGGKLVPQTKAAGDGKEQSKVEAKGGILWWGSEASPDLAWFRDRIRQANGGRTPRVLDPFAGGGAIPLEAMRMGCEVVANDLNPVAWAVLKSTLEYPQRLAGEARPLPGFALGDRSFMTMFLKAQGLKGSHLAAAVDLAAGQVDGTDMFDDPARPWMRADLSWHVRAWGTRVLAEVRRKLARSYPTYAVWQAIDPLSAAERHSLTLLEPDANGRVDEALARLNIDIPRAALADPRTARWVVKPAVAYLWARTVRCKSCRAAIPLLKTRWLCRKGGKRVRLVMESTASRDGVTFAVEAGVPAEGSSAAARKAADKRLGQGTMSAKGVWCPCCGRPGTVQMTIEDIQHEAQKGNLDAVMTAVVCEGPKGKEYRAPEDADRTASRVPREHLANVFNDLPFGFPTEPLSPNRPSPNTRGVSGLTRYGINDWSKVFTDRQLLALGTLCATVRQIRKELLEAGYPTVWIDAITLYLALANDRAADYGSNLCTWAVGGEFLRGTFVRFVLSIAWDYAEVNPLSEVTGGYLGAVAWIAKAVEHACRASEKAPAATVTLASATTLKGTFDAIVTDPPYYDAIPYSDLMDFFHVWLRRVLHGLNPEYDGVFAVTTGPKWDEGASDGELVDQPGRFGGNGKASRQAYEDGMARVFKACHASLTPDGVLVIVFANKQPAAWGALVAALIRAGFVVDASWPIKTERAVRTNAIATASLSSSVWLVCRKRPHTARPGYDRPVLEAMRSNITAQMRRFWDAHIRGPDFLWAATGPALEAYSRHPVVLREATASGAKEAMPVEDFLREVRRLVVEFAVGQVLHGNGRGEEGSAGTSLDDVTTYYLLHRQSFGMADAPVGAAILYALSCGLSVEELADRWELLARGKSAATGTDEDEEEDDAGGDEAEDGAAAEEIRSGGGSTAHLRAWSARTRKALGLEGIGGRPVPLVDRLHRLMRLWKAGDLSNVDVYLAQASLARDPLFAELVQAVIELARGDGKADEAALLEAISNHIQSRQGLAAARQAALL